MVAVYNHFSWTVYRLSGSEAHRTGHHERRMLTPTGPREAREGGGVVVVLRHAEVAAVEITAYSVRPPAGANASACFADLNGYVHGGEQRQRGHRRTPPLTTRPGSRRRKVRSLGRRRVRRSRWRRRTPARSTCRFRTRSCSEMCQRRRRCRWTPWSWRPGAAPRAGLTGPCPRSYVRARARARARQRRNRRRRSGCMTRSPVSSCPL